MAEEPGEEALGEDPGARGRVVDVVRPEERPVGALALAEDWEEVDDGDAVASPRLLQDLKRSLRREEARADPEFSAALGRFSRAHLVGVRVQDEDEREPLG